MLNIKPNQQISQLAQSQLWQIPFIEPVALEGLSPLSSAQEWLWHLGQCALENLAANISMAIRLAGPLDAAALEASIHEIVQRHQALRTTFALVDGQPMATVASYLDVALPLVDLNHLPTAVQETETERLKTLSTRWPHDLTTGPLLQPILLRLGEMDHVVLVTAHRIVFDDWSKGIFVAEMISLYAAFASGEPSRLSDLPLQYADLAQWPQQWLQAESTKKHSDYRKQKLDGAPPILALPTDRPRSPNQTCRGAHLPFAIPAQLTQALKALSQREGVALLNTLLAAFKVLLHRYTGQDDVLIGATVANRNRAEVKSRIGPLSNILALRTDLSGNPTFRGLLGRVREVMSGAYTHQDTSFKMIAEALQTPQDASPISLFQVMFVLQNVPIPLQEPHNLKLELLDTDVANAEFDLTVKIKNNDQELTGVFEYNTDLFDAATIQRMVGHLQTLLAGIAANLDQRLSDLPLLTAAEHRQLLVEWTASQMADLQLGCVPQRFAQQAVHSPDTLALTFAGQHLTYDVLNRRANQLAHHLQALGIGPEVLVGICMERSLDMVVGLLGVLKASGAYLPLDPAYPQERIAFMLADAQARLLLTRQQLATGPVAHGTATLCLDRDWATVARQSSENPVSEVAGHHLAYVIYTSGSTGQPKGVQIEHRGLLNLVTWHQRAFDLCPSDRATQLAGPAFDAAGWELWPYLTTGASLHLPDEETRAQPERLRDWLVEEAISLTFLPTPLAEVTLPLDWPPAARLHTLLTGGEKLHRYPAPGLPFALVNNYGPTENSVVTTSGTVPPGEGESVVPTIGRAIGHCQVYLLDEHVNPVPVGVPGEVYAGGEGLARGYLRRPARTAASFVPHPFSTEPGARLYRTGDLARYLPDGNIEFLGRADHQVKIRGFRIELGEIEAVIGQHPAVRETVVLACENELKDKRLVAYLVANQEQTLDIAELKSFAQHKLPDYMVPSAFAILEALPLTPNGKVDRRALPAPDWNQQNTETCVMPRTPVEEMLAGIWREVLGLERIGVYDNFFALGGHSLLATQVISRVRQAFQVELLLSCMFETPTVAALADLVATATGTESDSDASPIQRISREKLPTLSFAQRRLWLVDQLEPGNAAYNIAFPIRLSGSLNVTALEKGLNETVRRHETLRITFPTVDGQPIQRIAPSLDVCLPVIDLGSLSEAGRDAEAQGLFRAQARQPFALAEGPLLQVILLKLAETDHLLLLTMHHIITDGWSMGVLMTELGTLYNAFTMDQPSPLPELPIQYADFAHWQRERLQGKVGDNQLFYWKQQLGDAPAFLELPTDRPHPAIQTIHGAHQSLMLSASLSQALKTLSQQEGVTLFMTLLAAFQILLYRYTDQDDIVVGSPIANRNRAEIEGLIGFFVNTLVLRTRLEGNPTFCELLTRVRQTALKAYAHQDLPFEKLVEVLRPERDMRYNPLFQVMFILQSAPMTAPPLADLTLTPVRLDTGVSQFDLTLELEDVGQGLLCTTEYNTDLFDKPTILQILRHYQALLESVVADPGQSLSTLLSMIKLEPRQVSDAAKATQERDVVPSRNKKDELARRRAEHQAKRSGVSAEKLAMLEKRLQGKRE